MTATCRRPPGTQSSRLSPGDVQHLLALAGIGDHFVLGDDEAVAVGSTTSSLRPGDGRRGRRCPALLEVDHQAQRLALAAAARQLVGRERVDLAAGREQQQLVGGLGVKGELQPVAGLEATRRARVWPFIARIQPFSERITVIGSRSMKGSASSAIGSGARRSSVLRRPSGGLRAVGLLAARRSRRRSRPTASRRSRAAP